MIPRHIIVLLILCMSLTTSAFAQEGGINWSKGIITSVGLGTSTPSGNKARDKIKAIRTGKILAARNLLETIKGIHIDGHTLVIDSVMKKEITASRVSGMIRAARVIRTDVTSEDDGSIMAKVELAVCLTGRGECEGAPNLSEIIKYETAVRSSAVPEQTYIPTEASLQNILSNLKDEGKTAPVKNSEEDILQRIAEPVPGMPPFDPAHLATGLVVKVLGGRFDQALVPLLAVQSKEGNPVAVYSIRVISPESFRDRGMARYATSLNEASRMKELGSNVIMAKGKYGNKPGLILLEEKDAWVISEQARRGSSFLKQGNVVICTQ